MFRRLSCLVLALGGLGFVSQGYAADKEAKAKGAGDKVVESAFVLKKGVNLRPDQQQAYEKLKQDQEPKLREALEKKDKATSDTDKNAAALAVVKVRSDIKKQIAAILRQPAPPGSAYQQPQQPQRRCPCGRRG